MCNQAHLFLTRGYMQYYFRKFKEVDTAIKEIKSNQSFFIEHLFTTTGVYQSAVPNNKRKTKKD